MCLRLRTGGRPGWPGRRCMETEILDAVAAAAPVESELSEDYLDTMKALETLADSELWRLARERISSQAHEELEALNAKQRDVGLSRPENAARSRLLHEYERTMLIRAQAAKLLKDRGHDISGILTAP